MLSTAPSAIPASAPALNPSLGGSEVWVGAGVGFNVEFALKAAHIVAARTVAYALGERDRSLDCQPTSIVSVHNVQVE